MDELTATIEATKEERDRTLEAADKLYRQVELLSAKLEAFQQAARLRPIKPESPRSRSESTGKGRQPGAISKAWRAILNMMAVAHPEGADENDIAEIARAHGITNIRIKDVRDRMASYEIHGYVNPIGGGWAVTNMAIAKFHGDLADNVSEQPDEDVDDL